MPIDKEKNPEQILPLETILSQIPDRKRIEQTLTNLVEENKPFDTDFKVIRMDNSKPLIIHSIAVREDDANGKPVKLVGTIQDVTDRKRSENERLSLERQVQHAQKLESLGVLAGGIAHDFNNLLMVILGNADLAMDELGPYAPARENIDEILQASKRAAELAKQMLAYSGKGRFIIEPINLNGFVEEMAHLLEVSISKKAVLKYNFADNLPTFDGDATQIRQIIMNLITNASEAIGDKSGVIALSTGAMECDRAYLNSINETLLASMDKPLSEGLYTYIEVADTGCGMTAETMAKIFDPFFTTKFTGRGLGMAAVMGIVRGHGGGIKIYSELRRGTTFKILFPTTESPENSIATQKHDTAETDAWRGQGAILIADDEETVCAVGKQMLERMGFDVLLVSDGREAVSTFKANTSEISCILLDLTMPHMDGEEAFRELRRIKPDVAVILCSGYNEQDATQRFAGKGLAGFLQKPYSMAELRAKLMQVFPNDGN
ncbi:MAG: response regulator [bacterium]|nr:response regulator [bacterium]